MGICRVLINLLKVDDHQTKVICSQALLQLSREEDLRENLVKGNDDHHHAECRHPYVSALTSTFFSTSFL